MGFTGILPFRNGDDGDALSDTRSLQNPEIFQGSLCLPNIQQGYTHCESPVERAELPIPWSQSVGIVDNFRP